MSEPEFVTLSEIPSIADERWLYSVNGDEPGSSWLPVDLSELPDEPPVQPTLGSLGLVYPGKRHVFSGPQESAKTLAAYVIGIEVIRSGGGFCLIDFEMGRWDARNRLRELGATQEELAAVLYFEPYEKMSEKAMNGILSSDPSLVCIDAAAGAYDLQGLDDNKRSDVERFTATYVRSFWKAGIATIVLDHVVKSTEARGRYAIGSERKVGGADVHLGFEVVTPIKRGGHGVYKIVTHKDRGGFLKRGKIADFELRSDPDTHLIRWEFRYEETDDDAPFRPTRLMEKVSRWLDGQEQPSSQNEVASAVEGRAKYVRQALDLLVAEGFVAESEGPRSARMFEWKKAYREQFDPRLNAPRPTSSHLVPDDVHPLRPAASPPYGEADEVERVADEVFVPGNRDEVDDIDFGKAELR